MNNLDTIVPIICIVISLVLLIGTTFVMRHSGGYITYEEISPLTDEEIMNSSVYKWREAILHDLETRIIYAFGLSTLTPEEIKKVMHMSMVYDEEHDASRCTYVYENFILTLYIKWSGWFRSIHAQMELLDNDNFVPGETVVLAASNQVIMRPHHGIYNYAPLIDLINYMFNMESGLLNITEKDMAELDEEIAKQAKVLREAISTSITKLKVSSDAAANGLSANTIAAISYKSQLANSIRRLILLMRNPAARKVPGLVKSYISLMSNLAIYFGPDEWANLTAGLVEVPLPPTPAAAADDTTTNIKSA